MRVKMAPLPEVIINGLVPTGLPRREDHFVPLFTLLTAGHGNFDKPAFTQGVQELYCR